MSKSACGLVLSERKLLESERPRSRKRVEGFTLVELLVVITIIAILSVIGITVFTGVQKSARDTKRRGDIDAIAKAFEVKYNTTGTYGDLTPTNNSNLFSSGSFPSPPEGGQYTIIQDAITKGFKVCAALQDNPPCSNPSSNCICKSSQQADSPGFTNTTVVTNTETLSCPTQGLVGYWNMEQTSSPATDSSGNNNNGTWSGGVVSDPAGKVGNALNFNGTDGYVDAGNGPSLNITNNLTIAFWMKAPAASVWYPRIISRLFYGDHPDPKYGYMIYRNPNASFGFLLGNGTSLPAVAGSTFTPNEWTHIAATFSQPDLKVYVNGDFKSTATMNSPIVPYNNNLRIGHGYDGGIPFEGSLDEVRIYNKALTQPEIQKLYTGCI